MIGTNRSVDTYRLANNTSPDDTTEYSASKTYDGIDVYIESVRHELDLVLGTKPGIEAYIMYVDAEEMPDLRVTDKVVDNKSYIYFVQGIKRHEENDDTDNLLEVLVHKEMTRYTD